MFGAGKAGVGHLHVGRRGISSKDMFGEQISDW